MKVFYAESYAECRYAECRYAECRGAIRARVILKGSDQIRENLKIFLHFCHFLFQSHHLGLDLALQSLYLVQIDAQLENNEFWLCWTQYEKHALLDSSQIYY
jgi:hypothetical protein